MNTLNFKLEGMHCPSCAVDIDLTLEELPGILSANTSYAKSETTITYDPQKITPVVIQKTITKLGYRFRILK